ncbi:DNA photolyase family protein [Paracoccus sp. C2R09]|nr:DNA photolyase family protein [Paracoccus sp. C2R09]
MTVICWFRRMLRLDDHPALVAAAREGAVVPLVILDPEEARLRPASALRQARSLPRLEASLKSRHSRLIVRRGDPAQVLEAIARETGATTVHATTGFPFYGDHGLQAAVERGGAKLCLHHPADLIPRGSVTTKAGDPYKVFTPFWKSLRQCDIAPPQEVPKISSPDRWPDSDGLDWPEARRAMGRGWDVVSDHIRAGADEALDRLDAFMDDDMADYAANRDLPWREHGTSELSDSLAVGEISARRVWHRCLPAFQDGRKGADVFLSEVAWREFGRELMHQHPRMPTDNWRPEWDDFAWKRDNDQAEAWRRGQTGISMVDAGMRELFVTGRMHNRVRMITGSYLTKNLLTDWRVGLAWFEHTLIDWDAASNSMNWQWVAGSGADASPFFRVFNPETQGDKFDGKRRYRDYWLDPESEGARRFAEAAPRSWKIDLRKTCHPAMSVGESRKRALSAYQDLKD